MIKKKTGLAIVLMISAIMPQAVKADEVYKDNHVRFTLIDEGTPPGVCARRQVCR